MTERILKIMVIGDFNVGKTTAIARFVDRRFVSDTRSTIGVDFSLKHMKINLDESDTNIISVALQIWDVAGEQKFREILPYYIQGTRGLILVFDDNKTLESLNEWIRIIGNHLNINLTPKVIISTKQDLEPEINMSEVANFMKKHNITDYFKTSSKTGSNIDQVFEKLGLLILKRDFITGESDSSFFSNLTDITS
ncbi:MAG: Rab family GTPase [Candidatus Hodarchaeales archaeon]|jgi:small GTP-binding protein